MLESQQSSQRNANTHKRLLHQQRLDSYLEEPVSDGNRLIMISDHPKPVSGQHNDTLALQSMEKKIQSVLRPFYSGGKV